jgi:hypothetical protein
MAPKSERQADVGASLYQTSGHGGKSAAAVAAHVRRRRCIMNLSQKMTNKTWMNDHGVAAGGQT